jgi:hypothetical protein
MQMSHMLCLDTCFWPRLKKRNILVNGLIVSFSTLYACQDNPVGYVARTFSGRRAFLRTKQASSCWALR